MNGFFIKAKVFLHCQLCLFNLSWRNETGVDFLFPVDNDMFGVVLLLHPPLLIWESSGGDVWLCVPHSSSSRSSMFSRTRMGNPRKPRFRTTGTEPIKCLTCRTGWVATPSWSNTAAMRSPPLRIGFERLPQATPASVRSQVRIRFEMYLADAFVCSQVSQTFLVDPLMFFLWLLTSDLSRTWHWANHRHWRGGGIRGEH